MNKQRLHLLGLAVVAILLGGCAEGNTTNVNVTPPEEPFEVLGGKTVFVVPQPNQPLGNTRLNLFESASIGSFSVTLNVDGKLADQDADPISEVKLFINDAEAELQSITWIEEEEEDSSTVTPPHFEEVPRHQALLSYRFDGSLSPGLHKLRAKGDLSNIVPTEFSTRVSMDFGRQFLHRPGAERQRVILQAEVLPLPLPELAFLGGTVQMQVDSGEVVDFEEFRVKATEFQDVETKKAVYRLEIGRDAIVSQLKLIKRQQGQAAIEVWNSNASYEEGQHIVEIIPTTSSSQVGKEEEAYFRLQATVASRPVFIRDGFNGFVSATLLREEVVIEPNADQRLRDNRNESTVFEVWPLEYFFEARGERWQQSAQFPSAEDGPNFFVPDQTFSTEPVTVRGLSFILVDPTGNGLASTLVGQDFVLLNHLGLPLATATLQLVSASGNPTPDLFLEFRFPEQRFVTDWSFRVVSDMTATNPQVGDVIRPRLVAIEGSYNGIPLSIHQSTAPEALLEYAP